jgi:protein SCO1/2
MTRPWLWGLFAAVALGVPGAALYVKSQRAQEPQLLDLGAMPRFSFTDQRGQPFAAEALAGSPWVGNFVFTRCSEVCPMLTQKMRVLKGDVRAAGLHARFVSFSVDPERDTPEVLAAFAEKQGADWTFLTGDLKTMEETVVKGFRIAMSKAQVDGPSLFEIVHGQKFVLVDGAGRIRGYFDADAAGLAQLVRALRALQERA